MLPTRRTPFAACKSSRGGFTLVELLVVIGIIAILAGVALGPITSGIKTAQHNAAMQGSRSLALLCFQYSIDNSGNYPAATTSGVPTNKSEGIAQELLQGKYTNDPTIFFLAAPGKTKYIGGGGGGLYNDFGAANISWNFFCVNSGGTITGVTSSASDLLPLIWCSGNNPITPPTTGGTATDLTLTAQNAFSKDGVAVTYKSNSAQFMRADSTGTVKAFIPAAYNDPLTYQEIIP